MRSSPLLAGVWLIGAALCSPAAAQESVPDISPFDFPDHVKVPCRDRAKGIRMKFTGEGRRSTT
jgi:hypothetical protein